MSRAFLSACLALAAVPAIFAQTPARTPKEELFVTPGDAEDALIKAATTQDQSALDAILGPDRQKLLSGDPVEDQNSLNRFGEPLKNTKLQEDSPAKYTLLIGDQNWPFPVPIVKAGDRWRFDTDAGINELLDRRIGENELSAIAVCRAYVLAQWEYYTKEPHTSHDGLAVYAQKFISTPGRRDGLYWETPPDGNPSPLGELVAEARAQGYSANGKTQHTPYNGYYFKILTRQGPHAPGGRFSYIINGNMIAGYALIAYPDKWGSSGVMTFIVNNQGRVYEKNLGPNTARIAAAITAYDPDTSWKLARDDE